MKKILYIVLALCTLSSCERTTYRSAVPSYPVHLEFNTNVGMYVHFVPENVMTYLIADKNGIHLNGVTTALTVEQAYGYAGTVIYIDGASPYASYDLCCPHCLLRDKPCTIDGMYAVCPVCGEEYDIYSGNGVPTHGIADEPLKRYHTTYNPASGKISVAP